MTSFRLIASDLDGTLLRSDGTISQRTREAVRAAEDAGFAFAFVTARPPRYTEDVTEALGLTGAVVCSNGAILYDIGRKAVLHREGLAFEVARELVSTLRASLPALAFAAEYGHSLAYDPSFPAFPEYPAPCIGEIEAFFDENLVKLLLHHPDHDAEVLTELVQAAIGERGRVSHSGGPKVVEIAATGVSKAAGLARLCGSLAIDSSEVIAFGDMPNDLPMLRFVGRAVAVANAHPDVLAAARNHGFK